MIHANDDPDPLHAALALHQRGDLAAATKGYRAYLAFTPDHPEALRLIGLALYQQGALNEANGILVRAAMLAALDRKEDAISGLNRVLDPEHRAARRERGILYQHMNRTDDAIADFDAAMDLVVAIDTAPAHLALGLGCETWMLLPFSADWRWGIGADAAIWYPAARLFRRTTPGDWADPLDRLSAALALRFG